jgi:hypothetical protein
VEMSARALWLKVRLCWLRGKHAFPRYPNIRRQLDTCCELCGAEYLAVYGR